MISDTPTDEQKRDAILNSGDWNGENIQYLFPNVLETDYPEIVKIVNDKIKELRMKLRTYDVSSLHIMSPDEFYKELEIYIKEVNMQYDTQGLKKIYDKISKVLNIIPMNGEYQDEMKIIEQIKKEYIQTKKMNKSSMLYLNKIYRQLTQEKSDEKSDTKVYLTREQLEMLRG